MKLGIVILAAGQGKRMRSALPKVLHKLAGRPLLKHVIDNAKDLNADRIAIVYGYGGEQVRDTIADTDLIWIEQAQQLGTGHAVKQALPMMQGIDKLLVLYGDVPLTRNDTLKALIGIGTTTQLALLTVSLQNPSGYGRIVRDHTGAVISIIEQKDASPEQLKIKEVNTGIMVIDSSKLHNWLQRLENNNSQGEFYLTDIVAMAVAEGIQVQTSQTEDPFEVMGVNDRTQLAQLERKFQLFQAEKLMRAGVTMMDPARFDLRGTLEVGEDVEIDINVVLEGDVYLDSGVRIGANTVIRNSRIGSGTTLLENCVIENALIGSECHIGPFSRVRPETVLEDHVHIGNFVEIKKSSVNDGSKINHLSYIGDCSIGKSVNIGAGTITCNYDGAKKHRTIIGDHAFIGSDTQLVAPVKVGAGTTIGAGATICHDTPDGGLSLSRAKQVYIKNWQRPIKEKKE